MSAPGSLTDFHDKVTLGRADLKVSRLGLGASFSAPAAAYEAAFERGVNYFYWGSLRRHFMGQAIRNLAPTHREHLVIVLQSYARLGALVGPSIERALTTLGLDYADVLLLGWHNKPPSRRMLHASLRLKERGLINHLAVSSHKRTLFPSLLDDPHIEIWHVRYNAVHRGAERDVFPPVEALQVEKRPGVVTFTTTRWGHLCDPKRMPAGERTPTGTDCYRFALSHPAVHVALAGPADMDQMAQALHALDLGPMHEDELAWMQRVGDYIYPGRNVGAHPVVL